MINNGISDIPDKTICVVSNVESDFDMSRLDNILSKSSKKREWFSPHFYRCLPLTIGNTYGFVIKSEFDFSFEWDGSDDPNGIKIHTDEITENKFPRIETHFGHGILTINPPFTLRTPNGVNLVTINPPNHVIPNVTVMTGVVETDNLRRNFTFNLKVQIPGIRVFIPKGSPLAGFIPVPRYYCDTFDIVQAEDIFSENDIEYEHQQQLRFNEIRKDAANNKFGVDRLYFSGKDAFGNIFPDHQKP